ncbi:hypothetical protein BDW_08350 [Bdellovibrio bacteriovorus W]|nr:hypothetical protein BDW_08350 [Bdellovibrio bacteriovorus W]
MSRWRGSSSLLDEDDEFRDGSWREPPFRSERSVEELVDDDDELGLLPLIELP